MFGTLLTMLAVACMQTSCTEEDSPITQATEAQTEETAVSEVGSFAKGADVSWLTQMENEGLTFANKEGVATECMKLLRDDCYVNSIR
ncbi:MAG: glycosyl hydrolase 53 family protein, partial [Bacteroidales bacterium]|nr:glycosyl hydrolase 53 family protein [Bacteroidales bacterium]